MWAQSWSNIADLASPFDNAKRVNITPYLIEQVRVQNLHMRW